MVKQHHRAQQPTAADAAAFGFFSRSEISVDFQDRLWSWKLESRPAAPFESKAECRMLLKNKTHTHRALSYAHATLYALRQGRL
jgi:hypothetical protein